TLNKVYKFDRDRRFL
nr:RecName: Full=Placental protein [Ovis aries]